MKTISLFTFLISGIFASSPLLAQQAQVYSAYMVLGACDESGCSVNVTDKNESIQDEISLKKLSEQLSLLGPNSELSLTRDIKLGDKDERNDFWWLKPEYRTQNDRKTYALPKGTVVYLVEPPILVPRPKETDGEPYVLDRSGSPIDVSLRNDRHYIYNNVERRANNQSEYYSEQWYKDVAKFQKKSINKVKQEYKPHLIFILVKVRFQLQNT